MIGCSKSRGEKKQDGTPFKAKERRESCEHLLGETEAQSALNEPANLMILEEQQSNRQRLIERLPEGQKIVIQLRIDGLSYEQIADTLGLTVSTVRIYPTIWGSVASGYSKFEKVEQHRIPIDSCRVVLSSKTIKFIDILQAIPSPKMAGSS